MTIASVHILRIAAWLMLLGTAAYAGACLLLFAFQRAMLYAPQGSAVHGAILELRVADAELRVSVRPHEGPKALVYFGGNGEDVSLNLPAFSAAFADHALYLLHYRGYGGSSGKPSEKRLQSDAEALFDKVRLEHSDIVLVGRSLGSGVAIRLASRRPVSHLILITPYYSIQEIAEHRFPYFPIRWLLTDKFESWRHAPLIRTPTLILAAASDAVIPRANTEKLCAAFKPGIASFEVIADVDHATISNSTRYVEAIREAVERH